MATMQGGIFAANPISLSFHSPAQNDGARRVKADEAANVFAEIDAKHRNLHDLPLQLSLWRIYTARRRGGPFHKAPSSPVNAIVPTSHDGAHRRAQWTEHRSRIEPERLVFIDETWTKTNMAPLRGWAPQGKRLKTKVPQVENHDLSRGAAP
jgi:hypothetical protein